jgi:hypothetical protein
VGLILGKKRKSIRTIVLTGHAQSADLFTFSKNSHPQTGAVTALSQFFHFPFTLMLTISLRSCRNGTGGGMFCWHLFFCPSLGETFPKPATA